MKWLWIGAVFAAAIAVIGCASVEAPSAPETPVSAKPESVKHVTTLATIMDCSTKRMSMDTLLRLNFPANGQLRAASKVTTPVANADQYDEAGTPRAVVPFLQHINELRRAVGGPPLTWSEPLRTHAQQELQRNYQNANFDSLIKWAKEVRLPAGASQHTTRMDEAGKPPYQCALMDVFKDWEASYPTLQSLLDVRYTQIGVASIRGGVRMPDAKEVLPDTYHAKYVIELGRTVQAESDQQARSPIAVLYPPPSGSNYVVNPGSLVLVQLHGGAKLDALEIRTSMGGKPLPCMRCAMPEGGFDVLHDTWAHQLPSAGVVAGTTYFATARGSHKGEAFEKSWSFTIGPAYKGATQVRSDSPL